MEEYSVGDVLRFRVRGFSHLALYIDNGRIVHFWSESGYFNFTVRENTIQEMLEVGSSSPTCYTNTLDEYMGLEPFSRDEIVERARGELGATGYNLVMNNCEHFVTWVRYGRAVSPQIRSSAGTILTHRPGKAPRSRPGTVQSRLP
ncbi:retinoic acid receptor responder (tazarotene induced) 3 [Phytophthora pseudosyringae]|uniref:phospholipase A2 n=1 Tax=Phytophthora pseudosyringae TaxID=221518 RepID=A0A8T1VNG6_9STRA|nr:retinoic acid receptor responder (tazarotene induced) 3 [Phytophthora pseudosyringae]